MGDSRERKVRGPQTNKDGAIGFIDGTHFHRYSQPSFPVFQGGDHHHHADTGAIDAIGASLAATMAGVSGQRGIGTWGDPEMLGIHRAIVVDDSTGLTPYIVRDHDAKLYNALSEFNGASAESRFITIVGTSCSGKTRSLYEGIARALPNWTLIRPRGPRDLARHLRDGISACSVVWLDELQKHFTREGVQAAAGIADLLDDPRVGPIAFVATIWPANLATLEGRPDPAASHDGMDVIRDLVTRTVKDRHFIPDRFTAEDLDTAAASVDPRLRCAIAAAQDGQVTQVLSGGTQLVNRMYPETPNGHTRAFSAGGHAAVRAAADLRRIGYPNPLPRWAIEGAAPGYIDNSIRHRLSPLWVDDGLIEATQDATDANPGIGHSRLDIHTQGVPALTPLWLSPTPDNSPTHYNLHDYLMQDHLTRHLHEPTASQLWNIVTQHVGDINQEVLLSLSANAERRGMYSIATTLLGGLWTVVDDRFVHHRMCELLVQLGDHRALEQLRERADAGDWNATRGLAELLVRRGGRADYDELVSLGEVGDAYIRGRLIEWQERLSPIDSQLQSIPAADATLGVASPDPLVDVSRPNDEDLAELLRCTRDKVRSPRNPRSYQGRQQDRNAIRCLGKRGDDNALSELRTLTSEGNRYARSLLVNLLSKREDDLTFAELLSFATKGFRPALYAVADRLLTRGDDKALTQLRLLAEGGDPGMQDRLCKLSAQRGGEQALNDLRSLSANGHGPAAKALIACLVQQGDALALAELRLLSGKGSRAATAQLLVQRGDDQALAEMRSLAATGDKGMRCQLVNVLLKHGQVDEAMLLVAEDCAREDRGDNASASYTGAKNARDLYAALLASRGRAEDLNTLRRRVHSADPYAHRSLVAYHRRKEPNSVIVGLNVSGDVNRGTS